MRKVLVFVIVALLLLITTFAGEPTKEDFINNAPKDYQKLLEAYTKMVDFAFQWKSLYEQQKQINDGLLKKLDVMNAKIAEMQKSIDRMEKTIDTLHQVILKLVEPNRISILGLYDFHSGGISLGLSYKF